MTNSNKTDASSQPEPEVKRGRGRPRKVVDASESQEAPKRGRGRPRKVVEVDQTLPKRGRGRPRKSETEDQPALNLEAPASQEVSVPATTNPRESGNQSRDRRGSRNNDRRRQRREPGPRSERPADEPDVLSDKPYELPADLEGFDLPLPLFRARSKAKTVQDRPERTPKAPSQAQTAGTPREPQKQNDRGRDRRDKRDAKEQPRRFAVSLDDDEGTPVAEVAANAESTQEDRPSRNRRGRRGRSESSIEREVRVAPERVEPVPVAPPVPEPVKREFIRIPNDAPQVVIRDGVPTLVRDGRAFPPIFFFGNAMDERRLGNVKEEIKLASEAGVHVFVHFIELEINPSVVDDSVSMAAYLLRETLNIDPTAQVIFRVVFTASPGWESQFPEAVFTLEEGGLGEPSVCDDAFWTVAEDCLRQFVGSLRMLPDNQHVMGLHLERGEWFFADGWGYDTSPAAIQAFRKWAKSRYHNDQVALCASWFDGQAQFETITVPQYGDDARTGEEFVRTGRKARRWVDYHLFLSDITVERIGHLSHAVKEASEGYFVVGVSYGYTFEWGHPASSHLALGKLLRNPEVDFIAGPPSYKSREPGGSCPFPGPIDSFALNGKLYISEEDFKTGIVGMQEPDDFNPVMRTPQALDAVHWRGFGAAAAHKSGVCWMDLWGNGWLRTHGIWDRGSQIVKSLIHRMGAPVSDPEVAIFIDERSLAYLVDQKAFELLVQNVRESVLRSGLTAGFYLLSDLAHRENFPEAKLYLFMNAWDVRPEVRSAIKSRLQRDNKVLFWLYTTGLFDSGRDAIERVREITGIALKRQPFASKSGTTLVHRKHPLCEALPEELISKGGLLEPSYFAIPEGGLVLAEYTSTGLPSFVMREFRGEDESGQPWTSVFLGEPIVTPALFRALGTMAGCHVWSFSDDVVHAQPPFLTIHCKSAGNRVISLPDKFRAFNLATGEWMASDGNQLRLHATDGATFSLMVGLQSEIDAILRRPAEELLHIEELPNRPENTIKYDDMNFDIEIMRMDAWVEESWNDEFAEDLIFKTAQFEGTESFDTSEEPSATGGRTTRQRGRRRRGGNQPNKTKSRRPASDFDISEMNVVFRKRE